MASGRGGGKQTNAPLGSKPTPPPLAPRLQYCALEDDHNFYFLLRFCEGTDLFKIMHRRRGIFSETQVVQGVMQPFLEAIAYLHSRGVVHRDVSRAAGGWKAWESQ